MDSILIENIDRIYRMNWINYFHRPEDGENIQSPWARAFNSLITYNIDSIN
jgi:hypothetical protein